MNRPICVSMLCVFASLFSGLVLGEELEQVSPAELRMDETYFPQIDVWINQLIASNNIPGAVAAIGRGNRLALLKTWGERQRRPHPEPITLDTLYDLASVGKVVGVAPCICMLIDQGKVAPNDTVNKYLSEFTGNGKEKITIHDFLTHMSGIQDGYSWTGTPEDIWRAICRTKCKARPGEQYEYSCLGFLILGKVVERVSGETFTDYTRNHVYVPLGMVDTMFNPDPERCRRAATTQFLDGKWLKGVVNDTRARRMGGGTGNGGNFSTITDMAIYASVMLNKGQCTSAEGKIERLFSPEAYDQMVASYPTPAGIRSRGWDKRSNTKNRGALMSPRAIGHGGWTGTSIWIDPAFDTFLVVLSTRLNINPSAPNIYPTVAQIADRVIDSIRDPHNETAIRLTVRSAMLSPKEKDGFRFLADRRVGLIADSRAVDTNGVPSVVKMLKSGVRAHTVFCRDDALPGMITAACMKAKLSVPGLYKLSELKQRRLLPQHVQGLDALVFDSLSSGKGNDQTVTDLGRAMQTAMDNGLAVFVLDRPNPAGMTQVSGDFAAPGSEPAIAFRRLPTSYAMSLGELALMFNQEYRLGMSQDPAKPSSLAVVPYEDVEIPVPGTEQTPVVTQTLSLKGDMAWFQYQRGLYLIYRR